MDGQTSNARVVGIGMSAGGLDSLKELFAAMPAESGMAFVVIQHLDPSHVSYMAELLAKQTEMAVAQAEEGMAVQANSVYTIPPNKFLLIKENTLHLAAAIKRDGIRMPIDFFFRSLAQDQREKAIGVLLSGSGSDGTLGIREIHAAGGIVIVQEPETAQFDFMLRSALATGLVDSALPPAQIGAALLQYVRQADAGAEEGPEPEAVQDDIHSILGLLAHQTGSDFHSYKKNMVWRRIQRRMGLNQITDISDYGRFLREKPDEMTRLSKDMLIGVTSFFRDPEAFDELRIKVISPLVQERNSDHPLRVWAVGCSTGEEAYSIAMLIREEMSRKQKIFPVQIFASDIDPDALKCAREGTYPESIAADVSDERLKRFFTKKDHSYQINKEVRESVTFAAHNLIADPPFLKIDLISCRNLLIYIEAEVQQKLQTAFAFVLNPEGYLFLGKSDGIPASGEFEPVSKDFRIYRRKSSAASRLGIFPMRSPMPIGLQARIDRQPSFKLSDLNQEVLLKHFDAAVVLIDEAGGILHFYGPTHKYLSHPTGDANLNLFEMVGNRHSLKLRFAVEKAFQENGTVTLERVEFGEVGSSNAANITISCCVPKSGTRLAAAIFQEVRTALKPVPVGISGEEAGERDAVITQLEAENKSLKEDLQATIDGYQTSHEELTAANEEVLAINEELQSTNEELETSKEEQQSVNEELVTVNNQLNEKVEELNQTNDDLANFLNSTDVGTIFLDTAFRIRRFTPSVTKFFNLIPSDVGRPVDHISSKFIDVNLVTIADSVLKNLSAIERQIQSFDGSWYMMRCLPYRTLNNVIDGVVFTFGDVTMLKRSEESAQAARNYAESIVETIREPLLVLNGELRVVSANRAFYQTFRVSPQDTENRLVYELGNRQWDIPRLRQLLENILPHNTKFDDFEVDFDFPNIGQRSMLLNARRISNSADSTDLILLAIEDISERKLAVELFKSEEQLRQKTLELEQQLIASGRLVSLGEITASMAHEFNNPLGIIMGFAEDLLSETDPASPQYKSLAIIDEETKRCEKIIRSLLEFARPTKVERRAIDVPSMVKNTLDLVANRLYKQKIEQVMELEDHLAEVDADPSQLEQVLVNLYLNAIDAMPDGGTLTVRASEGLESVGNEKQNMVIISVTDTGFGIEPENVPKIFHPFFTAKKKTGLGLGLPICERIVKNHGGKIEFESQPGTGTTFKIYLPLKRTSIDKDIPKNLQ
jgi:two-component system, chemotaxis family, CheB/CheR fusion protein